MGVFFSLTLSSLSVSSFFMSKIRIEKTFSFSHGITGKAERIPERETVYGGADSVALVGEENTRACPCSGLKQHIHNLTLQIEHGKSKLFLEEGVLLMPKSQGINNQMFRRI